LKLIGGKRFTASTSKASLAPIHDYTSRYGSVSSLNLSNNGASSSSSVLNGYLEQTPIEATRLDGTKLSFRRKKRVENWLGDGQVRSILFLSDLARSAHTENVCDQLVQGEDPVALAKLANSSLEKPFHRLVQSIESDATMLKKQREADAYVSPLLLTPSSFFLPLARELTLRELEGISTSAAFGSTSEGKPALGVNNLKPPETQLWTDRYRPKKFTDLLGDEVRSRFLPISPSPFDPPRWGSRTDGCLREL